VCYHYHFQKPIKEVAKILRIDPHSIEGGDEIPGVVNGFSHPRMPVLVNQNMERLTWGLIPFWVKTEEMAQDLWNQTLNARWETIHDKPSFQKIKQNRCIVPCTGFFEWKQVGKSKMKHNIEPTQSDFLFLAGMFDEWVNPNSGEILKTFSIITQPSNELMSEIHNTKKRMPVLIDQEKLDEWFGVNYREAVVPTPESVLMATPEQSLLF
jgi:putative SOS response-associated peptidase YedK